MLRYVNWNASAASQMLSPLPEIVHVPLVLLALPPELLILALVQPLGSVWAETCCALAERAHEYDGGHSSALPQALHYFARLPL